MSFFAEFGIETLRAALLAMAILAGIFTGRAVRMKKNKKEESV